MNLFISYRRADTEATARALQQKFLRTPDVSKVFLDHDAIPKGKDFAKVITKAIKRSGACIILIGPNWRGVDEAGTARLSDPDDFVRREVELALQGHRHVIVALTDETPMPLAKDLPESLHPLLKRNAHRIRQADFKGDTDSLLDTAFGVGNTPSSRWDRPRMTPLRALFLAAGGAAFAGAITVIAALLNNAATTCPDVNCTVRGWLGFPKLAELAELAGSGGEADALHSAHIHAVNTILILALVIVFVIGVALPFLWRKLRRLVARK
jgi:hypothetical protein